MLLKILAAIIGLIIICTVFAISRSSKDDEGMQCDDDYVVRKR